MVTVTQSPSQIRLPFDFEQRCGLTPRWLDMIKISNDLLRITKTYAL